MHTAIVTFSSVTYPAPESGSRPPSAMAGYNATTEQLSGSSSLAEDVCINWETCLGRGTRSGQAVTNNVAKLRTANLLENLTLLLDT